MSEQHIITDQDRRAHSEGKIAISPNYKADYDPYLSLTSKKKTVEVAGNNVFIQVQMNTSNMEEN